MIHTQDMEKISITGPKDARDRTIDILHELGVLDIDAYDESADTFSLGTPMQDAEKISNVLVRLRSLKETLPEVEVDTDGAELAIDTLDDRLRETGERVESLREDITSLQDERQATKEELRLLRKLEKADVSLDDIRDYDSLDIHIGTVSDTALDDALPAGRYELYTAGKTVVLFVDAGLEVDDILRDHDFEPFDGAEVLWERSGDIADEVANLERDLSSITAQIQDTREELTDIARTMMPVLEANEFVLERQLERAEAPVRFATSANAFIAEGWVPTDRLGLLSDRLEEAFDGSVHLQTEEDDREPPVEHDNPEMMQPFESLTDLMAVPKYNDIDPTFLIMLTFPLFFGFMIGDAGYGLTTGIVFWAGMKLFPAAKDIFRSLLWASAATFIFGLVFGDAFGYIIFGAESVLAGVPGLGFTEHIPILFHRAHHVAAVFQMAAIIGVVHVNLGLLVGAYKEYVNHDLQHAIMEKLSWIVLEIGAVVWYLYGSSIGAPVLVAGFVMLAVGEGIEGVVEIPSLLSNILSYLRIFGVAVAAISLAAVVNSIAQPLFDMGSATGWIFGTLVLVVGHVFNTFIKIMEGFLQGIRLHYVEMFSKFYDGGGRPYKPFGGE